ncbi:MAG: RING finger protein [Oscillospiraceae bacterium]
MLNFIGENCPVCGEAFKEGDDIVVCPICGTPHHRECYKIENKCANEEYHKTNRVWEPTKKIIEKPEQKICPNCKGLSPRNSEKCIVCGQNFGESQAKEQIDVQQQTIGNAINDIKINGIGIQNFNVYLRSNQRYFVSKWKQHENDKFFLSFNWSAFIFSFVYYYYRKMYRIGSAILLLILLTLIPVFSLSLQLIPQFLEYLPQIMVNPQIISTIQLDFTGLEGQMMFASFCAKLPFLISLLGSLLANFFYRKKAIKDIEQIIGQKFSLNECNLKLYLKGGVSLGNAIFIIAFVFVMYVVFVNIVTSGMI